MIMTLITSISVNFSHIILLFLASKDKTPLAKSVKTVKDFAEARKLPIDIDLLSKLKCTPLQAQMVH